MMYVAYLVERIEQEWRYSDTKDVVKSKVTSLREARDLVEGMIPGEVEKLRGFITPKNVRLGA
jgi:hypothetical protein